MSPSHRPLRQRVRRIPKGRHVAVRREEFDRLIDLLNQRGEVLNRVVQDQQITFQRIAQIQADLDVMKRRTRSKP
jgi:hypothetical protein